MKRECGGCTLCCKLLPIPPLKKPAGKKCEHQRTGKGCAVHGTPKQPQACGVWFCRWLINDDADNLSRPDRARYVIDMLPDEISMQPSDGSAPLKKYVAIQIWADGDAWFGDTALRDWILRKAEQGTPTIVRYSAREAIGVFAPPLSPDGQWYFSKGTINPNMGLWK
jgi:hypothetical protein